jgi:hypothetical protein
MVGDDQNAAGLERVEHRLVHLRAIDRHEGRVVIAEKESDRVEIGQVRVGEIIVGPHDVNDVRHRGRGQPRGEFLRRLVRLRVDLAAGRDRAGEQFRAIARAGRHIEDAHSRLRSDEREQCDRISLGVVLAVGFGTVLRGDDRAVIRGKGGRLHSRRQGDQQRHHAEKSCLGHASTPWNAPPGRQDRIEAQRIDTDKRAAMDETPDKPSSAC